jgi:hypothetical protein
MPDVNIRWLNRRLIWIVVAIAASVSLLVALATVLVVTTQASDLARTNAIGGCDGVNLIRGDARLLTHRDMPTKPDDRNLTDWLLGCATAQPPTIRDGSSSSRQRRAPVPQAARKHGTV